MAWRFNDPVNLELDREEAHAVYDAILFVIEEQENSDEAVILRPVAEAMKRQTERRTYSISKPRA